jgi:ornithine cyclodeaminase/alanine dehydrogenase-like protein (mu-crystallin family)
MEIRILSAADVRQALPMGQAIEAMRSAFGQLSANQAEVPLRTRLETDKGLLLFMPAYLKQSREIGFKMVSIWGDNPSQGLPAILALAAVIDPETGRTLALINGEALTAVRTGAGGGLATELLARSDAQVVAVFGSGVQARAQLEAACEVRQVREVRILGRTAASVEAFAAEIRAWPGAPAVSVADSPQQAVAGADIVITATTSRDNGPASQDCGRFSAGFTVGGRRFDHPDRSAYYYQAGYSRRNWYYRQRRPARTRDGGGNHLL